jgi:hypothetical protein
MLFLSLPTGLAEIWKTKKWQTRVMMEMMGIALVDSFLLARKFLPRWASQPDTDSVFWRYVRVLLPQLSEHSLDHVPRTANQTSCHQVLMGKAKVVDGDHVGRVYGKQGRCKYCTQAGRKEPNKDKTPGTRARRSGYTCIAHKDVVMCKIGRGCCWDEHVADVLSADVDGASANESE